MIKKIFPLLAILCGTSVCLLAQDFPGASELVTRRTPWLKNNIRFYKTAGTAGSRDIFILSTKGDTVIIKASSPSAATKAVGYYLKNYCQRSMSHLGDNLSSPGKVPQVPQPVTITSNADARFALNYCAVSYSMSFYTWQDWEHELGWMALNGVNLMLAPVGMEKVWQNTLERIGCSDAEIKNFIAGPAFSAWWLMGNLEGWGGPVTNSIIDQQYLLEKDILGRMRSLGVEPVMPCFYGMAPNSLKHKGFSIVPQGKWAGGFVQPAMLAPDENFKKIAGVFYTEMKNLYGSDIHYFSGDPFHEGGKSAGIDVAAYGQLIQHQMQQYFPKSTWLLQGWQNNPSGVLLSKLDRSKVMVLELFGENTRNWLSRSGYEGTPFIWCTVSNFGEKNGLYGKLQRFANEAYSADTSRFSNYMKGVGIMPEGVNNNPVAYDLVLDLAWQLFLQTIYSSFDKYQEGPGESIFCARPALNIGSVSSWGTRKRNYDTALFREAALLFSGADNDQPALKSSETYQTDKVDFLRQVNANLADIFYQEMMDAILHITSLAIASGEILQKCRR